ncbi:MAG: type II toxin-antitoxin system VapC family toxin [Rhodospirillales bacterium]|nr:type II toxin-antitoxin system VapC family toxin [Rhodospirillales bacterium]
MGLVIDTSVFIRAERDGHRDPVSLLPEGEEVGFCSITLSELLEGIHYATRAEIAQSRRAFVTRAQESIPLFSFDAVIAEIHARLRYRQRSIGKMTGAHDLIIAATAISLGWDVLTFNAAEFGQIDGLGVKTPY